jgi:hypothetical protein
MNRLWVFGDNSSCIFGKTKERRFEYYKKHRNDNFPISWSELLSNKLDLKLNNYAIEGQSNYDIFEWFCKVSNRFQKNDIVLIGWSNVENYRLFDEYTESYVSIRPNAIKQSNNTKFLNGITLNTINEVSNNRSNKNSIEEISNWEILIDDYCKLKECKVLYWSFDKRLNKPNYIGGEHISLRDHLISIGAEDITMETNGLLNDDHFGEKGHFIQSEYFSTFLT